jgi:hypothetical protein
MAGLIGDIFNYVLIAAIVFGIVYLFMNVKRMMEGFEDKKKEGFEDKDEEFEDKKEGFFGGVVRGAGHPDCLRTLDSAARVLDAFKSKMSSVEEGADDFSELQLILSKLACLKKDLMSPSGIVEATRYQPYATSHDIEPVAEITATCLNHTIPSRDLDIAFGKWRDRGNQLIRRLCTAAGLKEAEVKSVEANFKSAWEDVYQVSKGRCLQTVDEGKGVALVVNMVLLRYTILAGWDRFNVINDKKLIKYIYKKRANPSQYNNPKCLRKQQQSLWQRCQSTLSSLRHISIICIILIF